MSRLTFLLRGLAVMTFVLLTACGSRTAGTSGRASPDAVAQRTAPPVTLTLWHSWTGAKLDALNNLARSYEQARPTVRISLEAQPATTIIRQYSASVADGSAPQLLLTLGRYIGDLAERKYVAPLDGVFTPQALATISAPALDSVRYNKQVYALPLSYDALVLFYDRRYVGAPPATFDQVIALNTAQRNAPADQRPWSLGYYLTLETTLPYLSAYGGALLDANGKPGFATDGKAATTRWLDWVRQLQRNDQVLASDDFSAVDTQIQANRVWSVIDWAHRRANYAQIWGSDAVGVAPLPTMQPNAPVPTLMLPDALAINTVTSPEQRAAAEDFLRFMNERASQETLASRGQMLPVQRGVTIPPDLQPLAAAVSSAQPLPTGVTLANVWRPLNDMFRSVVSSATTTTEAIDTAGSAIQKPGP